MDNKINNFLLITSVILCLTLSGCSGAENDQPDLGLVNGVVTLDGQPLSGASISFLPDSGRTASARTDANGYYELTYIRDTLGCKLGQNKVVITTLIDNVEDDNALEGDDAVIKIKRVKETLPAKYNRKTELAAMVKPGENTFDFKLTKSGK
ncbi:MAG: carboxypeptidase-like regulatory domain-containing protein [Planctomycetes bacterium]|nr:carboxypeptidase-like regulatory domain-containing protein [Planctomycetota bacterium]MCH9725102.1 carboxypeptidase-like regulatory domain-containing protein [Planctomycetota bacterium]MCH9774936.1 carboxypeptidase-like regulatory domain-containing protein [Planctomycetota bacterium]MDF1743531.1 carboxypeptidase-like regulatory domain-containing protein [Gimesia sp.]